MNPLEPLLAETAKGDGKRNKTPQKWTNAEEAAFLDGLARYGRDWAAVLGTGVRRLRVFFIVVDAAFVAVSFSWE